MASLPPQRAVQRHTSPERVQSESSQPQASLAPTSTEQAKEDTTVAIPSRPPVTHQDTDVKKCWICFADETEDLPETSEWRSPCPCALVAHEECLLDWIADMESPSSRKRSIAPPKLLCPQCKSEIHLARPWNPIVELVKSFDRAITKITTPCAVLAGLSTISHAFTVHGVHSIFAIFGQRDGLQILSPYLYPAAFHDVWDVREALKSFTDHWRLHIGLPLITPMLILSRSTAADSLLPVLPIVFFATQGDASDLPYPSDSLHWPPSASLTIAVLPYLRGVYNAYYARVWAPHVQRWSREIQPRTAQQSPTTDADAAANRQHPNPAAADQHPEDAPPRDEEGGVFEIRVDGNLWDNWGADEDDDDDEDQADAAAGAQQPLFPANADPAAPQAAPPLNAPPQQPERERRLSISTSGLAERILGALLFPSLAGATGEVLRLVLPRGWTREGAGLLGRKWGRSVVGGCLFVVIKDAVMLYFRWKVAQQHRKRRVLDYRGPVRRRG